MKWLLLILFLTGCTYDYTVRLNTAGNGWSIDHAYSRKNAVFEICYHNGYTLGFTPKTAWTHQMHMGKDVLAFEVLNSKRVR